MNHQLEMEKLLPEIRFPEFSDEWTIKRLGDLIFEKSETANSNHPLYSLTIANGLIPKPKQYEREFLVKAKKDAYKKMIEGDFAYNPMNLRFGALARLNENTDIAVSKYYAIFHCNNKCNDIYMSYYLTTKKMIQYYDRFSEGTLEEKRESISAIFWNLKKPFPQKNEQEKIASFLTAVDSKIEKLTRKKRITRRIQERGNAEIV